MNSINEAFGIPLVISRVSRPDRRRRFEENAKKHNFSFNFFDAIEPPPRVAVDALSLGLRGLIEQGYLGPNFPFHTFEAPGHDTRGARTAGVEKRCRLIGCRLSHLEAMSRGANFVMEDDALLKDGWEPAFDEYLRHIPNYYDVLYLSCGLEKGARQHLSQYFERLLETYWGNWAYFVTDWGKRLKTKYLLNVDTKIHCDTGIRTMGYLQEAVVVRPVIQIFRHDTPQDSDTQGNEFHFDKAQEAK